MFNNLTSAQRLFLMFITSKWKVLKSGAAFDADRQFVSMCHVTSSTIWYNFNFLFWTKKYF